MKKIVGDDHTEIMLEAEEAKTICRLGQGSECCAFLVVGGNGFECIRMSSSISGIIFDRLEQGTMNAKGRGEWDDCPWARVKEEA